MNDISRLFQAFLAPALFVSATALLILSINVRLMGIVSRLRQYVHAKHDAAKNGRVQEADAYTAQIQSIERRAETGQPATIRRGAIDERTLAALNSFAARTYVPESERSRARGAGGGRVDDE